MPIWEEFMSRQELSLYLRKCYKKFYLRPSKVLRNIFNIRGFAHFKSKLRGFLILIGFGGYRKNRQLSSSSESICTVNAR